MTKEAMERADERIWVTEGERKRTAVRGMFAEIAPTYDLLNGLMSMSLHRRWRSIAVGVLGLKRGDSALDVCCGTGDFLIPLRRAVGENGRVVGMDFCAPMLERAHTKDPAPLALADTCQLPVASSRFDGVTVGWGIRNVPDIDVAHSEIARVLRPGGRFVSLDMAKPRNPLLRTLSGIVFNHLVPRLGALFGKTQAYTYLPKSTERFWTREQLSDSMVRAGFTDVRTRDLFFGNICLHTGRKPGESES